MSQAAAANPLACSRQPIGHRPAGSYTQGIKTAISIPEPLFRQADDAAADLGISRSELYRRAVAAFLAGRPAKSLTERMNEFVDAHPECNGLEPGWQASQAAVRARDPW